MSNNGNPSGRRPIEREYLATLNAAVPLDTWQAICKRAADDALADDANARDCGWPPGYQAGNRRLRTVLAEEESRGEQAIVAEGEIAVRRQKSENDRSEAIPHPSSGIPY